MKASEMAELLKIQIQGAKSALVAAQANEEDDPQCPSPNSLRAVTRSLAVLLDMQVVHIEFLQQVNGMAQEAREARQSAMWRALWGHGLDLVKLAAVATAAYIFARMKGV